MINDYLFWFVVVAAVGAFFYLRQRGMVKPEEARRMVREGALVIDVRSEAEHSSSSLPGVVNVPLGVLADRIGGLAPDKSKVILCHCASGARSASAASTLHKLGYDHAYNLGSFARAGNVLASARE